MQDAGGEATCLASTHRPVFEPAWDAANVVLTVKLVVLFQLALQLAALLSPGRCCRSAACTLLVIIIIRVTVATLLQLLVQQRKATRRLRLVAECCHCCRFEHLILGCQLLLSITKQLVVLVLTLWLAAAKAEQARRAQGASTA